MIDKIKEDKEETTITEDQDKIITMIEIMIEMITDKETITEITEIAEITEIITEITEDQEMITEEEITEITETKEDNKDKNKTQHQSILET